jgi:hypothetical protein
MWFNITAEHARSTRARLRSDDGCITINRLASARTSDPVASVRTTPTQGTHALAVGPRRPRRRPRHLKRRPLRQPLSTCISCATPDLFLKHPDTIVATYKRRQMKHLKQSSETLVKTPEKHLKTIANIYNIQMKHLQTYVWNLKTLKTYVRNMHVYTTSGSTFRKPM